MLLKKIQLKSKDGLSKLFPRVSPEGEGLSIEDGGTGGITAAEACKNLNCYDLARHNEIQSGDNLNDYINLGVYVCPNYSTARTLINTPITGNNFKLIVESSGAAGYVIQTIKSGTPDSGYHQYSRVRNASGEWTDWAKGVYRTYYEEIGPEVLGSNNHIEISIHDKLVYIYGTMNFDQDKTSWVQITDGLPVPKQNVYGCAVSLSNPTIYNTLRVNTSGQLHVLGCDSDIRIYINMTYPL